MVRKKSKPSAKGGPAKGGDRILQQIKLTDEEHNITKIMAIQKSCYLMELYDQIADDFISFRNKTLTKEGLDVLPANNYVAHNNNGRYRSMWLLPRHIKHLRQAAEADGVTLSRVMHSAVLRAVADYKKNL